MENFRGWRVDCYGGFPVLYSVISDLHMMRIERERNRKRGVEKEGDRDRMRGGKREKVDEREKESSRERDRESEREERLRGRDPEQGKREGLHREYFALF